MDTHAKESGSTPCGSLTDVTVAFLGKLAATSRKQAAAEVTARGGRTLDRVDCSAKWIVIGEGELPLDGLYDELSEAAERGELEILSETDFWQRLGLVNDEQQVRQLYTPAMLAELLGVSVAAVRRWQRRGLITPAKQVHRLAYFDFREVQAARRLAELLAAGVTPQAIERKLARWREYLPQIEQPLAQLPIIVDGKDLLLRKGDDLIEAGGQHRIDFESAEGVKEPIVPGLSTLLNETASGPVQPAQLIALAEEYEESGDAAAAIEAYRAALAATGPDAEICFRLAELLFRIGDISAARERYYMAIEIDEDYAEARANLGCLLLDAGQHELAIAAFEGALACHGDYPDVHYQLARALDETGRREEAAAHWRSFLELSPGSPWSDVALQRLNRGE
jgi:tetratricopeptide (TPR) repeat protein